nr:putative ribonuclease H-like domain-containing protein [Tanacetum cinerariifolium]
MNGNYMPTSTSPNTDESSRHYRKQTSESTEIKSTSKKSTFSFDFSDKSSVPTVSDPCVESARPNNVVNDSEDFTSRTSTSGSEEQVDNVCSPQEDVSSSTSLGFDVQTSDSMCNKFGSVHNNLFRNNNFSLFQFCYVCGSYLHLFKACNFHQHKGKGILGKGPSENHVNTSNKRSFPIPADKSFDSRAYTPYYPKSKHFPTSYNSYYSMHLTNGTFRGTNVKPSADIAKNTGIADSGCSRSMSGNRDKLDAFVDFDGGPVRFGGSNGMITRKGTIKTKNLDFENVLYVPELEPFNLISISQVCDQSHRVLFTGNECLVLSNDFPLPDPSMVILFIPRTHNLYTFSLEELAPQAPITCLLAKASQNESNLWHRRLGHVNFRNMNKMVKGNLIRGLPNKMFPRDQNYIACNKGKQHKASYKGIPLVSLITTPLYLLHMDLFGPTSMKSITNKYYCLVITDEFTRCNNGTEFKNANLIALCASKGIKMDYINAKTPQQNGVSERKNRTLIEAARTLLADSLLPTIFWTEAVATACYVLNRVLVAKPHNKTPYELLTGDKPAIGYLKPFGCQVTILNTSDYLGKFDEKADEGYIVGYSIPGKAYRVYNLVTGKIMETMNIKFLENLPSVEGTGQPWLFDIDYLTDSLNYARIRNTNLSAGNQGPPSNNAGFQDLDSDSDDEQDVIIVQNSLTPVTTPVHDVPNHEDAAQSASSIPPEKSSSVSPDSTPTASAGNTPSVSPRPSAGRLFKSTGKKLASSSKKTIPAGRSVSADKSFPVDRSVSADKSFPADRSVSADKPIPAGRSISADMSIPADSTGIFSSSSYDDEYHGPDISNQEKEILVNPVTTKKVNEAHPHSLIIGDLHTPVQTRMKAKAQEELQQFQNQRVWVLVDLPEGKHVIGTKWILKNKRDAGGIVCRNKARLVAQGHRQEKGINYTEVFAPVARVESIRLFLAFVSYMGFMVYQMDVKSAFLNGEIQEEVYVTQPKGFEDPKYPKRVYKVVKAMYGLHQAPRAWYATLSSFLLKHGYRRGTID